MPIGPPPTPGVYRTWKYALLGGLVSMPLVLIDYWLSGLGDTFPTTMVFFGGLLAGFLAQRDAVDGARAAMGAGVVGGLPGYVFILPAMVRTSQSFASAWSSPLAAAVLMVFMGLFIIGINALTGLIGGMVGGWLAKKIHSTRSASVST